MASTFDDLPQNLTYDASSRLTREQFGTQTALYHKRHYNVRGQLYDTRLSSVNDEWNWNRGALANYYSQVGGYTHGGSAGDNNGNLLRAQYFVPGDEQINTYSLSDGYYAYDALNRLMSVSEYAEATGSARAQAFIQAYAYDRFGNRQIDAAATWGQTWNPPEPQFSIDTTKNQLGVPSGSPGVMSYDTAGHLTTDTYTGGGTRSYDAEGRMTSAWGGGYQHIYTYDAAGQRARRTLYGQTTWHIYGFDGELLAEYAQAAPPAAPQKEYGYRAGELLVTATAGMTGGGSFNAAANFSAAQNPTGAWSYGYRSSPGTTFTPYPAPAWYDPALQNAYNCPQATAHSSELVHLHPGAEGQESVVRWTAPSAGTAQLTGRFENLNNATTDVHVQHNSTSVFDGYVNGQGSVVPFSLQRTVAAGDVVEFVVGAGGNGYGSDSTGLAATITLAGGGGDVQWLVADHLGTPRMVVGQSGALVDVKRHDYLPFGEELFAGTGGRTTQQGYSQVDNVRQKFAGSERDAETNLDFMQARYYSSTMGRFTSVDPLMASADVADPQTWNRYTYALNNPLAYIDPDGLKPVFGTYKDLTEDERRILDNSSVTVGKGKNAQTLSGQKLYDYLADSKNKQQKQLANFLNQTAVLNSVKFENGRTALSYVNSVSQFKEDRIIANVDKGLEGEIGKLSSTDAKKGTYYVGPEDSGTEHGIYNIGYRENRAYTSQQLSLASSLQFGGADIDIDEECPYCGSKMAAFKHGVRVVGHKVARVLPFIERRTNPYGIYDRLTTQRAIQPSYKNVK